MRSFLGAFFLLLFPSLLFLFFKQKQTYFLVIKAHLFGLLSTLRIWFLIIPSFAFNKCQQISHGPYLNFSKAATICPAGWVFGGKQSDWTHAHTVGYCCMYLCQICTWLSRAIYSWCMQLHIVIILTEHTNKSFV